MAAYDTGGAGVGSFTFEASTAAFTASGSDRYLLIGAGITSPFYGPTPINEARYGGSGGTLLTQIGADVYLDPSYAFLAGIVAPPTTETTGYTRAESPDEFANIGVAAMTFTGVDQTGPNEGLQSATGNGAGAAVTASITVTGVTSGQLVAGYAFFKDQNSAITSISAVSGTSLRQNANDGTAGIAGVTRAAAGSTVTLEVTCNTSSAGDVDWIFVATALVDASGGGGSVQPPRSMHQYRLRH